MNRNANAEDDHSSTPDAPSQSLPGLNQLRGSTASAVFIEILLVADKSMLQRYGSDKLPVYALATMNEVSYIYSTLESVHIIIMLHLCLQAATLFHSQSLSVDVQLIVTHLVILEGDQRDLRSSRRAGRMLANFCSWKNNNSADFPSHDVAVFLTRYATFRIGFACFGFVACELQNPAYTTNMGGLVSCTCSYNLID